MGSASFAQILDEQLSQPAVDPPGSSSVRAWWQAPWRNATIDWRRQQIASAAPRPQPPVDCLRRLGLREGCTSGDIKKAYRQQALAVHPDRRGGTDEAFVALHRAYEDALELVALEAA